MIALLSQAGLALASLAAAQPAPPPLRKGHDLKRIWRDVVQEVRSDEIIAPRDEPRTRRRFPVKLNRERA